MGTELARLATRIADLERRLSQQNRTSRLAYSSIEGGAIEVHDDAGSLRAVIGQQPDGTTGVNITNGPPPPQPTQPTVTSVLGGIAVTWHGTLDGVQAPPLDFARIEIHATTLDGFAPTPATLRATIETPVGCTVTVPTDVPLYVRLVARNTSGASSEPSVTSGPVGPAAVVAQEVLNGIVTEAALADEAVSQAKLQIGAVGHSQLSIGTGNLIPDPSFEGAYTEQLIAGAAEWTLTEGNGSPRGVRVDGTSSEAASRSLRVTELAVSPGDRFFLAIDYRVSADWAGDSVRFYLCWQGATGAVLGYGTAIATPTPGADWATVTDQVQAPAQAVTATVWLQNFQGTAGTADFDNAQIRTVIGAGMVLAESIGTLELAAESITGEKVAAKTITAREVQALSLTGDEMAANTLTGGHIRAGTLDATHLRIGTTGNVVADASYETGLMASTLPEHYEVVDGGNNSAKALRIETAPGTYRYVQHWPNYVQPGERYWIGADYKGSEDFTAAVAMYLGFYDADGTRTGSVGLHRSDVTTTWQRMTEMVEIPADTVTVRLRVAADGRDRPDAAGYAFFDNLECRAVLTTPGGGQRAELSPAGLRLFDEQGGEAVSLTTGTPNYLTLTDGSGTAVATIDQDGNTGVGDLAVAGELTVGGQPLESYLSAFPRGLVAIDYQAGSMTASTTYYGFVELSFDADASRMYRVVLDCYADPSASGGELTVVFRDGGASTPTINSTQIQSGIYPLPTAGYRRVHLETIRSGATFGAGLHRLLVTFRCKGGPSGQTVRLFGGSNHHGLFYIEDIGPYVPETGKCNDGGGTAEPPTKQYTKTYTASWSGTYANRSSYNSFYGNKCVQGYYSSNNGTQAALIGFPSSLGKDLSGAKIQKVELYLYYDHWYYNGGGKAVIKAHNHTSRPSKFSSDSESKTISWGRNVGRWIDITSVFDSTSWRGVALDPNSKDKTYYGRAQGVGQAHPPQLRVTYIK
ncbi:hypothetical protein CIB93_14040 [Streptomyces sp. WZ.A104]|uniref:hypothetical protein n=1 Tax=Streptomyces sp. WZ.A104 TaxID=2023771 RepID=UPI000BBBB343|nr:hypothetical protein [Streptomyces sp. WZ.A104]PCG85471.1 hypothetical protein CIB93_14040 [Streptomyces sp. WZ.A104]